MTKKLHINVDTSGADAKASHGAAVTGGVPECSKWTESYFSHEILSYTLSSV